MYKRLLLLSFVGLFLVSCNDKETEKEAGLKCGKYYVEMNLKYDDLSEGKYFFVNIENVGNGRYKMEELPDDRFTPENPRMSTSYINAEDGRISGCLCTTKGHTKDLHLDFSGNYFEDKFFEGDLSGKEVWFYYSAAWSGQCTTEYAGKASFLWLNE